MQSFRTEIENPVVEKEILELEKKIRLFKEGKLDEESFRSLRLARGVYGQRQAGVQMIRIKFPLGIINAKQLNRLAEVADVYADGNLHITTRQDVQVHHVSLDHTPQLWAELEKDEITLREACGNTVRNITASPLAGVDPEEPFDITPYGWTLFEHFLRNPIGQELGRKFKIAISSSEDDTARAYLHDLGLIPKIKNGKQGFKVLLGGGLGAQPFVASVVKEFLTADKLVNYATAALKVFDQYGERTKRNKARLKYLIKERGVDFVKEQVEKEYEKIASQPRPLKKPETDNSITNVAGIVPRDLFAFGQWRSSNLRAQKNKDRLSIIVKVRNGNLDSDRARGLAQLISNFSLESARLTIEQNLVIRSVPLELIGNVYEALVKLNLADNGAETIRDITSCPGTKTCNLGITSTYNVSEVVENLLADEFTGVIQEHDITIKISGCMNACGQHTIADIGFHGSSIKADGSIFPALQLLLGGSNDGNGHASFADKVIKFPSKRVESVIRILLNDFLLSRFEEENFNDYYRRYGKTYFYDLLKSTADLSDYETIELLDWGADQSFIPQIGVGECAGVKIDLVKTLLFEAEEKLSEADYFIAESKFQDSLYTTYSAIIQAAKAFLIKNGAKTNSKNQIAEAFEPYFPLLKEELNELTFRAFLDKSHAFQPDYEFTLEYLAKAKQFLKKIDELTNAIENEK